MTCRSFLHVAGLTGLLVLTMSSPGVALAQTPAPSAGAGAAPQARSDASPTAMMAMRQQMMARMTAQNQKLSDLIAKMNSATGNEKVAAIAAAVTELAAERMQMQTQMMRMQTQMVAHMLAHRAAVQNPGAGATPPAATCPMMPEVSRQPESKATEPAQQDHSAHHPDK